MNTEEIVEWHKKTFPDASEISQILKLDEEFKEYKESSPADVPHAFADCLIVAVALTFRYKNPLGKFVFEMLTMLGMPDEPALVALREKMQINRERVWIKMPDGSYIHEEKLQ